MFYRRTGETVGSYATTDISEEELAGLEKEYDGVYQRLEGAERILVAALRFFPPVLKRLRR